MYLRSLRTSFYPILKISNKKLINHKTDYSSSLQSKEFLKKETNKRKGRLRVQNTQWLKKVDEIKKQNEPKEELHQLKAQYNLTEDNQYEILNKELIPLYLIDYETQCKIKTRRLELFLKQFVDKISIYVSTVVLDSDGYPCVFNDLIKSELIDEYQSQNEFQINIDVNKHIAVGLIIGSFKDNKLTCIRPIKFIVSKKSHRLLAEKFEKYLNEKSKLNAILDFKSKKGNWVSFFVRSNEKGEHICLAKLNDQNLTDEKLIEEKRLLKEYFQSNEFDIKSFYLEIEATNNVKEKLNQSKLELLFGDSYLPVKFNEKIYNITAKSLFPINVEAYLKIINLLIENLDLMKSQNLIFVSPYSGLGLPEISKLINTLFVLSKNEEYSNDCKKSLEHLLVKNIKFTFGNLMKGVFKILDNNSHEISIVIRQEDLSFQILNELRSHKNVSKIVIISTKPQENLLKFWIQLCLDGKKNMISGPPFNFISATPIDTHPHSNIYTIVSVFERIIN